MRGQGSVNNFIDAGFDQTVGGNDDAVDAIIPYKHIDDFRDVAAQRGFAAGEPEVGNPGHRARDFFDLLEGQIPRLIQLFVIETRLTKRVAARSDKKNDGAQTLLALAGTQELN